MEGWKIGIKDGKKQCKLQVTGYRLKNRCGLRVAGYELRVN